MDDTPITGNRTTPPPNSAARRALFLALLRAWRGLAAFLDTAAGHLPVVPLCRPRPAGGCDMPAHNRHGPCPKPGKTPRVRWKRYQDGLVPTAAEIAQWRRQWPAAGWAILTGPASGLLLLDQDGAAAAPYLADSAPTIRVQTGRDDGWHYWHVYPDGARIKSQAGIRPGVDVRGVGGLAILPDSPHASGKRYELDRASLAHGLATLPDSLRATLETPPARVTPDMSATADAPAPAHGRLDMAAVLSGVPEGQRDDTLFRAVATLHRAEVPQPWAEQLVLASAAACSPPYPAADVLEKVRRVYAEPPDTGGEWVPRSWLDKERADHAETKAALRAADTELATLKRQAPEHAARRLVEQVARMEADPSTRGLALPTLVLLAEHQATPGAPIPWQGAARQQQLGRDAHTIRKAIDRLEERGIVRREYRELGNRRDGDWRRELHLTVAADLPTTDLPDALGAVYRRCQEPRPPRTRPKQRTACGICGAARCPTHPHAAVQKSVRVTCTECGAAAAPAHAHAAQRPSDRPAAPVLFVRPPQSEGKNSPPTSLEKEKGKNSLPTDTADVDATLGMLDQLAARAPLAPGAIVPLQVGWLTGLRALAAGPPGQPRRAALAALVAQAEQDVRAALPQIRGAAQ